MAIDYVAFSNLIIDDIVFPFPFYFPSLGSCSSVVGGEAWLTQTSQTFSFRFMPSNDNF